MVSEITNNELSEVLERVADLLEVQGANHYRVRAYRQASQTIANSKESIAEIASNEDEGRLEQIPNIGRSIAGSIREYVQTGRLNLLDRLEGVVSPEALFATVPGIGPELAARIHEQLGIDTLEELEEAAHEGTLANVEGIGQRRLKALKDILNSMLFRSTRRRARRIETQLQHGQEPNVSTILEIDSEYREKVKRGELQTIAPRRFNPTGEPWLPIYHTERDEWNFTLFFSNTAQAHEMGRTKDWVLVIFERHGDENQRTVVTEYRGPLRGKRVVRGREQECVHYYRKLDRTMAAD